MFIGGHYLLLFWLAGIDGVKRTLTFSQAILLCNLLLHDAATPNPFHAEVGVKELKEFRIKIKRSVEVSHAVAAAFMSGDTDESGRFLDQNPEKNPVLVQDEETGVYTIKLLQLLEADSAVNFLPLVTSLKRCATCWFIDEATDTLILDYWVNPATKQAFRKHFNYDLNNSPIVLFQAFQVLLTLNLYAVNDKLKAELYQSDNHYIGETVPTLASDQRIMQFETVKFSKQGVKQLITLKELSDGEHQLLHSLGLCLLFKNTNSLFLLDEPETHFNPDWRSNYITRLRNCLSSADNAEEAPEMLITTHTPFLISDSKPEKVLVFKKDKETGTVSINSPDYNTLGASINKITMSTFGKRETIGGHALELLEELRRRFTNGEDKEQLLSEINRQLGDSVEKVLLIKTILDSMEGQS